MKQQNPFKYSSDNKRYHTLSYYNKANGIKSYKAVIDAGLSCPNIDGRVSYGGCIFCDGSGGYFVNKNLSIKEQIDKEIERIYKKTPGVKITAYFQSNTNTYCSLGKLREMLDVCLNDGRVSFISLGTRPDCIDEDKVKLLSKVSKIKPVTIELGLQTVNDKTAEIINRGYKFDVFLKAYKLLREAGIRICVHLIDGLPSENKEDMIYSAKVLADLNIEAIKIHLLHVIKGTKLHRIYENGYYTPLEMDEYIDIVISQLEVLPPETVIERITGDGDKEKLIAPLWSRDQIRVLGTIDKIMAERNTFQSRLYLQDSEKNSII